MTTACSTYYHYTYRSDRVKMREQSVHQYTKLVMKVSASGDTTYVQRAASDVHFRAHYGNYVKETGMPDKIYNEEGYIALHGDSVSYHFFERDYLGSTRAVIDESGNVLQSTAYYPSGVPLTPNSLSPQTIKLHTGKDYFDLQGAGWYDNQARYYDCLIPSFKSQDPLAEKYPWLSPYCHCANNPLRFVDPDGMRWVNQDEINDLATNITNKINSIENDIIKKQKKLGGLDSNSKKYSKLQAEITELNMRIDYLNQSLSDITLLANDNNLYDLYYSSRFSDGQHHVYLDGDIVMIQTSSDAYSIHEIVHIRQALMSGGLNFSKNGYLQNPGIYSSSGKRLNDISNNEVEAYKAQYSFDKSFPIFINSIFDITIHSIGNLKDKNNNYAYPFIKWYSDIINRRNK